MNKGFTLVELLAVIVILAIIGAVGIVSYTSITEKSEKDYYVNLIDNLELGATNYFVNNRSKRPGVNEVCSKVSLKTLIDTKYIESANDAKGNSCDLNNSFVYIKRNSNKQYEYKTHLICDSYKYDASGYCVMYGDVNEDGVVDSKDATKINNYLAGNETLNEQAMKNADVNADGKIDNTDSLLILQFVSGWHENTLPGSPIKN